MNNEHGGGPVDAGRKARQANNFRLALLLGVFALIVMVTSVPFWSQLSRVGMGAP